jgi:uncharacterized protein (UPF0332 family)
MKVFSEEYVHKDNFSLDIFRKFMKSQTLREQADYDFKDNLNEKIAKDTLLLAKSFIKESSRFLKELEE